MKLRNTSILKKTGAAKPRQSIKTTCHTSGFTLIEILVVIGLFTLIVGIGMTFSLDSYRNYLFRSEYMSALNIMSQARNRAINNFNESPHTFAILADEYRLYASDIYDSGDSSTYESFPRNNSLTISPNTGTYEFSQLSGDNPTCDPDCVITFGNGLLTKTITVNVGGGIITN